jgi:hypothetical protein
MFVSPDVAVRRFVTAELNSRSWAPAAEQPSGKALAARLTAAIEQFNKLPILQQLFGFRSHIEAE